MEEKFIAILYEKIAINENIFIFKPIDVIKNATLNFEDDLEELIYDAKGKKVSLISIESPYVVVTGDYCFGYPITYEELSSEYPEAKDKEELLKLYAEEMFSMLNVAYYDEETDRVKVLSVFDEDFKEFETEDLFNIFSMTYDSSEERLITISQNDIFKAIKFIDSGNHTYLREALVELNNNIGLATQVISEQVVSDLKIDTEPSGSIDETLNKLNSLIGLDNVKKEVMKLFQYLQFKEKVKDYLNLEKPNLHMFFTGNPGTGKTTVARIIGELYYKMGYLKSNKVAEITPRDCIAEYVGQTAVKTANLIKKHRGGVIFIDEAYVFAGEAQQYAQEALVEILKELEKNETVFIFAGYKKEMKNFMKINPGFTSRIGYYLEYEDYTVEQLYEIFEFKINNMGFIVEENLHKKILKNLKVAKESEHFGNGRYIDKLINKIILEHSMNTEGFDDKELLITLTEADFTDDIEESLIFKQKAKIGF